MENRRIRKAFRHAAPRRLRPAIVISAGVLAVAATSSSLLAFASTAPPARTAVSAPVMEIAPTIGSDTSNAGPKAEPPTAEPPKDAAPKDAAPKAEPPKAETPNVEPPKAETPTAEALKAEAPKAPSEKSLQYDFQYQPNSYYCGPASTRIALTAQGHTVNQDELAARLGTTFNGTNSSHDIARVLNSVIGKDVYQVREIPGPGASPAEMDRLQADVVNAISNGRVVVANIVGGATDTTGFWRSFPGGHYITIVGYSDEGRRVQIADPSGVGPATYWMTTIDMANWMASRGYAY